ncbi:acetate non-utilizing protein 9 [Ceratobasidium sp. 414]|nr:acetate non-utilizing protein 9 [Ceratobasidium sp. 414]
MRSLGDDYVKAEFKRHQKVDNPVHIIGFLSQWKLYLDQLESLSPEESERFTGHKMDPTVFEQASRGSMSSEQIGQLYELMHATKDLWKPVETLMAEAATEDPKNKT